jgi:hypothetical protein
VQVHARQPERRRDERRCRAPIWLKCLAVENELGVELPRSPAAKDAPHRRGVHAQQLRERRQPWGERDDRSNVQIAVGPSIQPSSDPGRNRIIHARVAQRALNADGAERSIALEEAGQTEDRVQLQQRERVLRIVEVQRAVDNPIEHFRWERLSIHLEPELQRHPRGQAGPDAAEPFALDGLMEPKRPSPERLVAKRIEPEDSPSGADGGGGLLHDG